MSYNEREGKSIFLSLASSAFKQNRNRYIDTEQRLLVAIGEGSRGR